MKIKKEMCYLNDIEEERKCCYVDNNDYNDKLITNRMDFKFYNSYDVCVGFIKIKPFISRT